jgi:DNA-binding NtrC family response regulator
VIKADVRVVAATNRDLREAVARGEFRADLYYRVNVFDIHIAPLCQRRDDIAVLAARFLPEFAEAPGGRRVELSPDALEALLTYDWPGNVRELRNVLERATIICENGVIQPRDLSLWPVPPFFGDGGASMSNVRTLHSGRHMKSGLFACVTQAEKHAARARENR